MPDGPGILLNLSVSWPQRPVLLQHPGLRGSSVPGVFGGVFGGFSGSVPKVGKRLVSGLVARLFFGFSGLMARFLRGSGSGRFFVVFCFRGGFPGRFVFWWVLWVVVSGLLSLASLHLLLC